MTMTIQALPWEKLLANVPAFKELTIEVRQAFFQLKPSGDGQLCDTPEVRFLLKHGWADAGVVQPLVSERQRPFHEILHLGKAGNTLSGEATVNRYVNDLWGCSRVHFFDRLQRSSPQPWTNDRFFLAFQNGVFACIARTSSYWDWVNLDGADTRKMSSATLTSARALGQNFLGWITDKATPPSLTAVAHYLPHDDRAALILRYTTQNLALFLGYDELHGELTLGLHPQVYVRRKKPALARPQAISGLSLTTSTLRCDDLLQLLVAASMDPIQIRQDREFTVREASRVATNYLTVSTLGSGLRGMADRVGDARSLADALKFLQYNSDHSHIVVSRTGYAWLAQPAGLRQRQVLEWMREIFISEPFVPNRPAGYHEKFSLFSAHQFDEHLDYSLIAVVPHLAAALRIMGDDTWRLADALCWWGGQIPAGVDRSLVFEEQFQNIMRVVLFQAFLPFGLIAVHGTGKDTYIALTDAGRWMVGLTATWTPPHEETIAQPIIVQADHTVIFLAPAVALEIEIGKFAERCPGATGTGVLFRFTKNAVLKGVAGGLTSDQVITVLQGASAKPLPANVVRELTSWFSAIRHVTAKNHLVVEAPDEETAMRLSALIGTTARRITPLIVLLPKIMTLTELSSKLKKAGIMLRKNDQINSD